MEKTNEHRITVRLDDRTLLKLESHYKKRGSKSRNDFIQQAINFYVDSLDAQENTLLPSAVQSAIDGRLGMFEDRMAKLLFKLTVEMDMGLEMTADAIHADETYMRRLRAASIKNVKATNGLLSLKDRVTDLEDEADNNSDGSYDNGYGYDYGYGGDEWQN